jgi:murein DD-endopeptidase MepM/ murein hydrolase activator NlpD
MCLNRNRAALLLLLFILLAAPGISHAQEGGPIYIVQAGDTLSSIARRFGTTLDEIIRVNGISDPSRIFPGSELVIPGFPGVEGMLSFQAVGLGETISSIGRESGTSFEALLRLNHIVRQDRVFAGQALIVPTGLDDTIHELGYELHVARPGQSALEMAAKARSSHWALEDQTQGSPQLWLIPGRLYALPSRSQQTIALDLPNEIEQLELNPYPLSQGRTLEIDLYLQDGLRPEGSLGPYSLSFFPDQAGHWIGLQGIHALADPGLFEFGLDFIDAETGKTFYRMMQPLHLVAGDYGFQVLNGVPPETIDPNVTGPEDALIAALMGESTPERRWDGPFEYPSRYYTAEFVSFFGTRRSYNNGSLLYYHTGLDFYGQDVPIYAPAGGKVVFAGPLTVRGNATYIDHGWGVFSGYLHQSEIFVAEGDLVERGQMIGKVGATGRVTGPHLHWEIWVGGVPVQPLDWVEPGFPLALQQASPPALP